jgi:hypothetical protein
LFALVASVWAATGLFFPIARFLLLEIFSGSIAAESSNFADSSWTTGADLISVSR